MKKKSNFLLLFTLFGGLLFTYLFWEERLALNLLIYSIFMVTITFFSIGMVDRKKFVKFASAHLFSAVFVVINNSDLTLVAYYISLMIFVGFVHYQSIKSTFASFLASAVQVISVPVTMIIEISKIEVGNFSLKPAFKLLKYIILPIFIVVVFALIYSNANVVFAHYLSVAFNQLSSFFAQIFNFIFQDLSLVRFLHICLGILVSGGLLISLNNNGVEKLEINCKEDLKRNKQKNNRTSLWYEFIDAFTGLVATKKMALKTEYIIGVISFIALNILLVVVNFIDISTLWFGYKPSGNFSADLHQGTSALIFSIILAMAVILYFFRKNLNFYSKSKNLRLLAYTWMFQNFILIISVFIRDGYYIEYYGLTHKRIGVLIFATLCLIGLATVHLKVGRQKTLFYLFKMNGNIWFALLLALSVINWDVFISKYNIAKSDKIYLDVDYLLTLSDKTLATLDKNRSKLQETENHDPNNWTLAKTNSRAFQLQQLDERIAYFKDRYEAVSWLSWNMQDHYVARYFKIGR